MTITDLAISYLNTPYLWGGKNPLAGFDCSGFIEWVQAAYGMDPPNVANAQAMHDWFIKEGMSMSEVLGPGSLCFYGKSVKEITHVAMMINHNQLIEAGGGDSSTVNLEEAKRRGACVRIRPLGHRRDLVATLLPLYKDWVL